MDDTLGFNEQEKKSDDWIFGDTEDSTISVSSTSRVLQQNHDLHVLSKKEIQSDRPMIHATKWEVLAYYRGFATGPTKTQFLCMQQENFKTHLWFYLSNVLCKTLTTTYIYVFFSVYAPDSHFFISKMQPIAYGSTIAFIITAILQLVVFIHNTTVYLDYLIQGVLFKSPWNRCRPRVFNYTSVKCYDINEFGQQFVNKTIKFYLNVYVSPDGEFFQLAQIAHYIVCHHKLFVWDIYYCGYFVLLWITAALSYKLLFKRMLWQILQVSQIALTFILFVSFIHLCAVYFETGFKHYPSYGRELIELLQVTDIDLLSESTTAPPVIHVLSSRSMREIKPIQDSSLIVTSNAIFNIFRGFVSYLLKMYCDNMVKAPLQERIYSPFSLFYLWPIYFSQFYLGDLFGIIFFGLNFVNEYLIMVITFNCLTEAILNEWRCLKTYMVISFLILIGIIVFLFTPRMVLSCLCFFCIAVSTLMEVLIIFYMYPMGRLVDDLTFFSGVRPTKLRVITFWITPVFYTIKIYIMMEGYFGVSSLAYLSEDYPFYKELIYFLAIPMVLGALYAIYKYVYKLKMGFQQLFKPLPNWGPRDFLVRRLRKLYDSRVYIGSRAPRELSSYLFEKADLNAYKLDIRYDTISRRSTRGEVHLEHEKHI
ncbi:unnamed protein product [Colias eurytheme]|nr:unnamed protein product [Colias eurytheme]